MNRNKSISKYYEAMEMCWKEKDKVSLFLGNKHKDFNNISDLLTMNYIPFRVNKTTFTITLKNNSKILFLDKIEKDSLLGLHFNYFHIHENKTNDEINKTKRL